MNKKSKFILLMCICMTLNISSCSQTNSTSNSKNSSKNSSKSKDTTQSKESIVERSNELSPEEAKVLLIEGNERFLNNNIENKDFSEDKKTNLSEKGQQPFATILTCSDSRVPPELIFDQGLGDLFVIRNAGNVIDSITLGSIEYGAEHTKTPIVLVMGHEQCGAVQATVDGGDFGDNIGSIVENIKPSYEKVISSSVSEEKVYEECENENILNSIKEIKEKSPIIKELIESDKIMLIGAKYSIKTGKVTFLED